MLHHIEVYVSDLDKTFEFWSRLLSPLGYRETAFWGEGFTLAREEGPYLTFVQVKAAYRDLAYHRCAVGLNHLAFRVDGREAVDGLRDHCRENGIVCLYDERYPHANGDPDYYALYIEDPDRIKVEFVAV